MNWLVWKTDWLRTRAIQSSGPILTPRAAAIPATSAASSAIAHALPSPATNRREYAGQDCVRRPIARPRSGAPTRRIRVVAATGE